MPGSRPLRPLPSMPAARSLARQWGMQWAWMQRAQRVRVGPAPLLLPSFPLLPRPWAHWLHALGGQGV